MQVLKYLKTYTCECFMEEENNIRHTSRTQTMLFGENKKTSQDTFSNLLTVTYSELIDYCKNPLLMTY